MRERARPTPETGELLNIVALDQTGVVVTTEGALVRYIEVTPRNPNVMGREEQERISDGFATMAVAFDARTEPAVLHRGNACPASQGSRRDAP